MQGATPVKQNQGTEAHQIKIILALPKFGSHGKHRFAQKKEIFKFKNFFNGFMRYEPRESKKLT